MMVGVQRIDMKAKDIPSLIGTIVDILSVLAFLVVFIILLYAVFIMPL